MAGFLLYTEVRVYSNLEDCNNDNNCEGVYFVIDSEDGKMKDEVKSLCKKISFIRAIVFSKDTHCVCKVKHSIILDSEEEGDENNE